MASSLSAQLSQIAANSTNSLNLKAQKAQHGKSLIFEPRVASSQSFDTLYILCHEGFQELCLLDPRFREFQRTIFSEQSQSEDRTQMTASQNEELDKRIEAFLGLVGGRLRLSPAVKAVEWLIRRFRIHEYNTAFVLTTFLPYHTLPIFTTLLSILPANIPQAYKFLQPYVRSLTSPPRHTVVHTAINNSTFTSLLSSYVLRICKARHQYSALISFWAGVMTEAVSSMLDKSRSGRKGVQLQNEQEVTLRLLPILNEGLAMKKVPELQIACYMLLAIMASKGGLGDEMLNAMMRAVVLNLTPEATLPGIVCLTVLNQQKETILLPKAMAKDILQIEGLPQTLTTLSKQRRVDKLANGLCSTTIERLAKAGDTSGLFFVEHMVQNGVLTNSQSTGVVKALLQAANRLDDTSDADGTIRSQLASALVGLAEASGEASSVVRAAIADSGLDIDELELKLQTSIRPKAIAAAPEEDVDMDSTEKAESGRPVFSDLYARLSTQKTTEVSFLSHGKIEAFADLAQAFMLASSIPEDLEKFVGISLLQKESALFLTFFMRVWTGPFPVLAKAAALQVVTKYLRSTDSSRVDYQALIPYAIAALSDSAVKVRRGAVELLLALDSTLPATADAKKKIKGMQQWGYDDIYGKSKETEATKWLAPDQVVRLIREIIVPAVEECILDKDHINSLLERILNGPKKSQSPKKNDSSVLPQTLRASLISFLASHIVNTPVYTVKLRLLEGLNRVRGVSGMPRTKVLLPVLQQWAGKTLNQTKEICVAEQIESSDIDRHATAVVDASDKDGLEYLASIVCGENDTERPSLVSAVFGRMQKLWPNLKDDAKVHLAQVLMDVAQPLEHDDISASISQGEAMDLLRTVILPTEVLHSFLSQLPTAAKLADKPPATKRRRTSHGEVARTNLQDSKELNVAIKKVTFVLQLVDSSNPAEHPDLLRDLFNTLAEIQHFKIQVGSELGYLQGLLLSSLLSIMSAYKSDPSLKLDRSAVRADLLVDCVQKTGSPQVQNAALLLIASLADTAPELVLHSVMPIFTFMGSSVLRQNDEYSAHVIDQTIREVIPPLIASLRKEKGNPVTGAAELLLSFVAAYEHVPMHRRSKLYTSLVKTLGPEDFLFALLAMLSDKYGATDRIKAFSSELSSCFGVEVQLQSAVKYLDLVADVLAPKPAFSTVLLGSNESGEIDYNRVALRQLSLLPHVLSQKRLIQHTAKLLGNDDMESARVRELYSSLLEKTLALADTVRKDKSLHNACGDVLESVLGLLSTSEFVKSIEALLDRPNDDLRRKILRSLEVRIDQESQSNPASRTAMLGFLPQLTAIIRESTDILYKHTAVACVDKIAEKYGKKDLEAVAAAAETIASAHCLGQQDGRLRVMALLCLASLVDILREGIVHILPSAIPKTLEYMTSSVKENEEEPALHNAGYGFISALAQYLPYMISGKYLDQLLNVSSISAEADLDEEADESRINCLQITAKQIDAKTMFAAMDGNWDHAAGAGPIALREYIDILGTAIERHPKSIVTKHSQVLSNIFLKAFDLRRQWSNSTSEDFDDENMEEIEQAINEIAIKMIYKFNDSTFRPIFAKFIEWASTSLPKKDKKGRSLRLQSVYGFMAIFFDNLKSIVTSYATYVLDSAVDGLQSVNAKDSDSVDLWSKVLRTLVKCFEHDQDDFWQSPSHFSVIAPVLIAQFTGASSLPLVEELVPAVVELAAAADSADHHKEMNTTILKHMRSENTDVRLAAVKCQQALTDRLGEEWLSMLPEMLPFISELQEDDDEIVEKETHRWIVKIEDVLGESLDSMLQ